ncbi:MAG: preprotein translocase subunit SecA [Opitutales bacterium]
MLGTVFKVFAGSHHKRFVKKCEPLVAQINQFEAQYQGLSDEALRAKTDEFKQRFQEQYDAVAKTTDDPKKLREVTQAALDNLLPEAFAAVKNVARRLCGKSVAFTGTESVWQMVHYDVQLVGGIALHRGYIAEMQTGEGKTLTSTLPLYLNALSGRNCQLVTVNEYLAQRDAEWMGHIYKFLGLTVGCLKNQQPPDQKRAAYNSDITYGTASEFGFDYLRDNGMAVSKTTQVQRDHFFCIVDEVDSILVDEARVPLIISGPVPEEREMPFAELKPGVSKLVSLQTRFCNKLAQSAKKELEKDDGDLDNALRQLYQVKQGMPKNKLLLEALENGDWRTAFEKLETEMHADHMKHERFAIKQDLYYTLDERSHSADLTEKGRQTLAPGDPDAFTLPDLPTTFMEIDKDGGLTDEQKNEEKQKAEELMSQRSEKIHAISQLLRAYSIYERDKEYMVAEGRIVIIDTNTGRAMPGRRWSDGLHQAVEAKEGVKIEKESKTFATITVQNYFRLYDKLAGMTGTAETEAGEFHDIYGLDVRVIPTHKPCIRVDDNDSIFKTKREKFNRVVEDIKASHEHGQPVLCGTASVQTSEQLSLLLTKEGIPHNVLNAKHHQREAEIVSLAGQRGAVTIATNMAGRGTDIKLGEGVKDLGGLFVCGTERHESRRIDRQLRGRCSRQGDPGRSKFYVSLEDDLMRLFANQGVFGKLLQSSFEEGAELSGKLLTRSVETAQKRVEQQHYSVRKRLLQYDDVLNRQREVVYGIRNDAIHSEDPREILFEMIEEEVEERVDLACPNELAPEQDELETLHQWVRSTFPVGLTVEDLAEKNSQELFDAIVSAIREAYEQKMEVELAAAKTDIARITEEHPDAKLGTPEERVHYFQRLVIISSIDTHWQEHLTAMEDLRKAVSLRGYGQKDPLVEYKSEAFSVFQAMMSRIRRSMCLRAFRSTASQEARQKQIQAIRDKMVTVGPSDDATGSPEAKRADGTPVPTQAGAAAAKKAAATKTARKAAKKAAGNRKVELPKVDPVRRDTPKIGRNETVTIRKGGETKEMKFKKAEPLLQEGWEIVTPATTGAGSTPKAGSAKR